VYELLLELPDDSAFVASLRATAGDPAEETQVVSEFRRRRRWRGWTRDRELTADIRDCLAGQASPRPWDGEGGPVSGGRRVVELIPI
jgi:hypothetical protein